MWSCLCQRSMKHYQCCLEISVLFRRERKKYSLLGRTEGLFQDSHVPVRFVIVLIMVQATFRCSGDSPFKQELSRIGELMRRKGNIISSTLDEISCLSWNKMLGAICSIFMLRIWKKYIFILLQSLSKCLHFLFRYKSFIWIVDVCSILLHWAIYLSVIIKHNDKKKNNTPHANKTNRNEETQLVSMRNAECLQQPMPSAGTAGAQHCQRTNP